LYERRSFVEGWTRPFVEVGRRQRRLFIEVGGGRETIHQRREETIERVYLTYRRKPGGDSSSTEETVCRAQRSFVEAIPVVEGGHRSLRVKEGDHSLMEENVR
jgi:hypothetical protein